MNDYMDECVRTSRVTDSPHGELSAIPSRVGPVVRLPVLIRPIVVKPVELVDPPLNWSGTTSQPIRNVYIYIGDIKGIYREHIGNMHIYIYIYIRTGPMRCA